MEVPESGASRCLSAIVHRDSGAMLHLISVSAPCLTRIDELSSGTRAGTHRRRLGRSPAPPPLGSQMTVFRLDCRANEVEQLHVPNDACSSLPPTATPGTHLQSHNAFPNYRIVSCVWDTVLRTLFYRWFNEQPLLQEGQNRNPLGPYPHWRSRLIFKKPPGLNF